MDPSLSTSDKRSWTATHDFPTFKNIEGVCKSENLSDLPFG